MSSYAGYHPYTAGRARTPLQTLLATAPKPPRVVQPYSTQRIPESPGYNAPPDPWMPQPGDQPQPPAQGAPQGPTTATSGGTGGGGSTGTGGSSDPYANDPIYQQLVGIANENESDARGAAEAARKQLVINLGDPSLAKTLGLDPSVGATAQANPYSILQTLTRGHNANVQGVDQGTNKANLYYSSTRGRDLQNEQTGYQGNKASAYGAAQNQLTSIAAALLAAIRQAEADKQNAAAGAYGRHITDVPPPGAGANTSPGALSTLLRSFGG